MIFFLLNYTVLPSWKPIRLYKNPDKRNIKYPARKNILTQVAIKKKRAFDDTRFYPIPATLLPSLSCSLTLLSNFEPCADALDWEVGTHGLRISFIHRGRRYGSTYLPDVAVEQGWTKEETVESLMRKAGWDGVSHRSNIMGKSSIARRFLRGGGGAGSAGDNNSSLTDAHGADASPPKPWEEVSDFKAIRYKGLQAHANYSQWQEWRRWVADSGDKRLLDA